MRNAIITTYYCNSCNLPTKQELKDKFAFDINEDDFYINFGDYFDPFNTKQIPDIGISKRKDLVYGKIFKLRKFFEEKILNRYDNILHIDYSDTKFSRSSEQLFNEFSDTGLDIVISTEKKCWPYIETVRSWFNTNFEEKEFFYVNSGAVIAKTEKFYEILLALEKICLEIPIDFWDDQGVWQYYSLKENNLPKDENCKFFFSTAELNNEYYTLENGVITTKFGTKPYLIHDNSSFSLNLTKKI
jgi:hypothetical protein